MPHFDDVGREIEIDETDVRYLIGHKDGYESGLEDGRNSVTDDAIDAFFSINLGAADLFSFVLSDAGEAAWNEELYQKGVELWGENKVAWIRPADRFRFTMNFSGFMRLFGEYMAHHSPNENVALFEGNIIRLSEVSIRSPRMSKDGALTMVLLDEESYDNRS